MKKRIALAAVAALAGGLLVAAPASAAVYTAKFTFANVVSQSSGAGTSGVETATATQYSGVNNYATITTTGTGVTWVAGETETYLSVSGSTFNTVAASGVTVNSAHTMASIDTSGAASVNVATPANGTITITYFVRTWVAGVATDTSKEVMTLTVSTTPAAKAYNHSTVTAIDSAWCDGSVDEYTDAAGNLFAYKGVTGNTWWNNCVGEFNVNQYFSADASDTITSGASAKAVTVSLAGPGVLDSNYDSSSGTYLVSSGIANASYAVYGDGRAGVSTVTIAVNGVTVKTYTITFFGDVATYALSIDKAQIQAGQSAVLTLVKKDANGIAVPTLATWSDTGTLSLSSYQYVPGTETRTISNGAKAALTVTVGNYVVDTKTVVANFVTAGAKTVTLAGDKASYAPGEKGTFSLTAKNSDGVVVGDGTYTLTLGGSASLYSAPATVTVKNGAATFTGYLPVLQGPVVLTATLTGADTVASDAATLNISVVDPAAVAQAAAITALQTSVATLTTTVASLVASMTAQIKVINATMLKIQKALAALAKKVK